MTSLLGSEELTLLLTMEYFLNQNRVVIVQQEFYGKMSKLINITFFEESVLILIFFDNSIKDENQSWIMMI